MGTVYSNAREGEDVLGEVLIAKRDIVLEPVNNHPLRVRYIMSTATKNADSTVLPYGSEITVSKVLRRRCVGQRTILTVVTTWRGIQLLSIVDEGMMFTLQDGSVSPNNAYLTVSRQGYGTV